jgi:hypothetical protein
MVLGVVREGERKRENLSMRKFARMHQLRQVQMLPQQVCKHHRVINKLVKSRSVFFLVKSVLHGGYKSQG